MTHFLLLAAILGFTYLAYANSFHAPFLLDNDEIVLKDPRVHAATQVQVHRILTQQYWPTANTGLYRPLVTLSFLWQYAVLGDGADPTGYHWLNFLLHAVNIVLVYLLGLALFERIPAAVLLSGLWAVHPVLTEAVTNIVGRSDLLAAFSVLAALLCHRKAIASTGGRKAAWLAAILLATAVGIFSKESAIVGVAVFAVYDFSYGRANSWRSRIPSYAAAAIPCLAFLYMRSQVLANASYQATPFFENPLLGAGFWSARLTAIKVIGEYFGLLLWPARLSWDYSFNAVPLFGWNPGSAEDWKAVAALLGCIGVAVLALRRWRTHPALLFGAGFFFATLAPVSNLVILVGTIMGERLLYLPAVGFAIAAVWLWETLRRRLPAGQPMYRYMAMAAPALLLIGLAARTYGRNADWSDQQRFWLSGAEAAPGSYKTNMAAAASTFLTTQADVDRSIAYADRALAILDGLPDSRNAPIAYQDAGVFYRNLGDRLGGRSAEAMEWYRKSLAALLRSERIELVWDQRYREENARRGKPGLTSLPSRLYLDLGRAYLRLGDTPRAVAAFEGGRQLESSPELLEELASAYKAEGELRKAAQALVEALAVDSKRTDLLSPLVDLYSQIDPRGCAVTHEAGSLGLNTECPLVHGDLCAASRNVIANYRRRGQEYEAGSIRTVALHDLGCDAGLLQ